MTVHNNDDILMVHYEDLPDGDKDVISKAIEEFQNKCLLSYTKTRVDRILSAVLRGVSHEGRLIGRDACNREQEGNRDTRVRQVQAVSMT